MTEFGIYDFDFVNAEDVISINENAQALSADLAADLLAEIVA